MAETATVMTNTSLSPSSTLFRTSTSRASMSFALSRILTCVNGRSRSRLFRSVARVRYYYSLNHIILLFYRTHSSIASVISPFRLVTQSGALQIMIRCNNRPTSSTLLTVIDCERKRVTKEARLAASVFLVTIGMFPTWAACGTDIHISARLPIPKNPDLFSNAPGPGFRLGFAFGTSFSFT